MKAVVLVISFLFFTLSPAHSASFVPKWLQNIKWPRDRVTDQVKLLPFAQELKLNLFLQDLKNRENINIFFHFTPSLEGKDLDALASEELKSRLENVADNESNGLIFFLSLSDRKFKIHPSGALASQLSGEDLTYLVSSVIPLLSQQNYSGAISTFLSNFLFRLKGSNSYRIPELSLKKSYNLNSLLFFTVGALLIFMLGHKVRKSPKIVLKDPGLVKKKAGPLAIFW